MPGRSGRLLWDELGKFGVDRDMLHVTNTVKCYPSKTKTPKPKDAKTCSDMWLDKEVAALRPVAILLLGNTALNWATGQKSGIVALNGTTEWSKERDAWLCYCVHPASALRSGENIEALRIGLKNFARVVKVIGV